MSDQDSSSSNQYPEALRKLASECIGVGFIPGSLLFGAAKEIERLQRRVAELQKERDEQGRNAVALFDECRRLQDIDRQRAAEPPVASLTDEEAGAVLMSSNIPNLIIAGVEITPLHWFDYARAVAAYVANRAPVTKTDVCDDCGARGGQHYSLCSKRAIADMAPLCNHGRPTDHCDACEEDIERSHTDSLIGKLESVVAGETSAVDPMNCPDCDGITPRGVLLHSPDCPKQSLSEIPRHE